MLTFLSMPNGLLYYEGGETEARLHGSGTSKSTYEETEQLAKRRRCCYCYCCTTLLVTFVVLCAVTGGYVCILLQRASISLEPRELSVAFENGIMWTNATLESQLLPAGIWNQYALHVGKIECEVSSTIGEGVGPDFDSVRRHDASRPLFNLRFSGSNHKISNGLRRTDVWQVVIDAGAF